MKIAPLASHTFSRFYRNIELKAKFRPWPKFPSGTNRNFVRFNKVHSRIFIRAFRNFHFPFALRWKDCQWYHRDFRKKVIHFLHTMWKASWRSNIVTSRLLEKPRSFLWVKRIRVFPSAGARMRASVRVGLAFPGNSPRKVQTSRYKLQSFMTLKATEREISIRELSSIVTCNYVAPINSNVIATIINCTRRWMYAYWCVGNTDYSFNALGEFRYFIQPQSEFDTLSLNQ